MKNQKDESEVKFDIIQLDDQVYIKWYSLLSMVPISKKMLLVGYNRAKHSDSITRYMAPSILHYMRSERTRSYHIESSTISEVTRSYVILYLL
jgi:hypothetical protein